MTTAPPDGLLAVQPDDLEQQIRARIRAAVATAINERNQAILDADRLRRDNRRLVDERDKALDRRGEHVFAGTVYCDTPGCTSRIALTPLPADEADLVRALQALRWSTEHGHRCARCVAAGRR